MNLLQLQFEKLNNVFFFIKLSVLVFILIKHVSVVFFFFVSLPNTDIWIIRTLWYVLCMSPINRVPLYFESQLRKSQKANSVNKVVLFL